MTKRQKTLAEIREECRRFAAETGDPEVSRILYRAADGLERYARLGRVEGDATKH
jgi:hypothetical protein